MKAKASTNDLVKALQKVPLFSGLTSFELRQITDQLHPHTFQPGQVIAKEGEPVGRLYVILEGYAAVDRGGEARPKMGPGAFIGEMAVLRDSPRTATVTAETVVDAVSLSPTNFLSLLEDDWKACKAVLLALADRVAETGV